MKRAYTDKNFHTETLRTMSQCAKVAEQYAAQGMTLTLRQLYYQLVARDLVPNTESSYNRVGRIVGDARMTGRIDWNHIEDRNRALQGNSHWRNPESLLRGSARGYQIDKWTEQDRRVEVWIEKAALLGVISGVCSDLDVDWFACRGYTSLSEMHSAAQRIGRYVSGGQPVTIFHLGDHDPSGIDMTRDIRDRLTKFIAHDVAHKNGSDYVRPHKVEGRMLTVERIALTMDQIEEYGPPPNPAKMTDSRYDDYARQYGTSSWELDALEPKVLIELIRHAVYGLRDVDAWKERVEQEEDDLAFLRSLHGHTDELRDYADDQGWLDDDE